MKQRRYTDTEKKILITTFLERRRKEGISLRWYACEVGIPYYTLRDMYRDNRYNSEWRNRYQYSTQDNYSKERVEDNPLVFVRIV